MKMIIFKAVSLIVKIIFCILAVALFTVTSGSSQTAGSLPSAVDVVSKMVRNDVEHRSELTGYKAQRRYVAANSHLYHLLISPKG
jgi:hypothetical protein